MYALSRRGEEEEEENVVGDSEHVGLQCGTSGRESRIDRKLFFSLQRVFQTVKHLLLLWGLVFSSMVYLSLL